MRNQRYANRCLTLAGLSIGLLVAGPLLTRLHITPYQYGLLGIALSVLLALSVLIASVWGMLRRGDIETQRPRLRLATTLALPALAFAAAVIGGGRGAPIIHDISTDTRDPPQFIAAQNQRAGAENPLEYDPANAPLQQAAYADLHSIASRETPAQAQQHAAQVANAMGWEIYAQDAQQGRIEAVATTALFGFKDDIVIRIRPQDTGCVVDLRSVSRVGKGDLGANAKRIRKFIALFAQKAASP